MPRRMAAAVVTVAAMTAAWAFLWPAQFGGQATWLVVDSAQLEPYYADGDLVIAREQSGYADGTLVAAQGDGSPVLGVSGDVNGEVLGAPWLHVGGAGNALQALAGIVLTWPFIVLLGAAGVAAVLVAQSRRRHTASAVAVLEASRRAEHTLAS